MGLDREQLERAVGARVRSGIANGTQWERKFAMELPGACGGKSLEHAVGAGVCSGIAKACSENLAGS